MSRDTLRGEQLTSAEAAELRSEPMLVHTYDARRIVGLLLDRQDERGNLMRFVCTFRGHRWADWIDNGGRRVCTRCDHRRLAA